MEEHNRILTWSFTVRTATPRLAHCCRVSAPTSEPRPPRRTDLLADCGQCSALCCVGLPFARSADFALDKSAGVPCVNLTDDLGCGIHAELRERGFPGCTVFDCSGAGQKVTRHTLDGRTWRDGPDVTATVFAVFPVVQQLQEMLRHLLEALDLTGDAPERATVAELVARTQALSDAAVDELLALDLGAHRAEVGAVLAEVSRRVRSARSQVREHGGADLVGVRWRGADLRCADLRGALLLGADLREADLRGADLLGADLRGADLTAADLSTSLFVLPAQLAAARGGPSTRTPADVPRPAHWG